MYDDIFKIAQIIVADIILSGDNALVIGMAAAGIEKQYRRRVVFAGMAVAALLRIAFAVVASYLIRIPGILLFGGILLGWVCWRFYRDLMEQRAARKREPAAEDETLPKRRMRDALWTIAVADVSMSIDNVLAVAAIAREDTELLVFGLGLAIALMAFFATLIMKVLARFPLLSFAGLALLVYLSLAMIWDGLEDLTRLFH